MEREYQSMELVRKSSNPSIVHLYMNRPHIGNALTEQFFQEFQTAIYQLDQDPSVHVIVLSARGRHFCSGIEAKGLFDLINMVSADGAQGRNFVHKTIIRYQNAVTALEQCRKPVIAEIHGACIGGAVDLVSACDIRYCTETAFFTANEVDVALAADLGTLQRLPKLIGYGNAVELALTGRMFDAAEAKSFGFVSRVFKSREEMEDGVSATAQAIAEKLPLGVAGTKDVLLKSRDLSIQQGLDYVAAWNSAMSFTEDSLKGMSALIQKAKSKFNKL